MVRRVVFGAAVCLFYGAAALGAAGYLLARWSDRPDGEAEW